MRNMLLRVSLLSLSLLTPAATQTMIVGFPGDTIDLPAHQRMASSSSWSSHFRRQRHLPVPEQSSEEPTRAYHSAEQQTDQETIARLQQENAALKAELKGLRLPSYASAQEAVVEVVAAQAAQRTAHISSLTPSAATSEAAEAAAAARRTTGTQQRGSPYARDNTSASFSVSAPAANSQAHATTQRPCRKKICTPALKCLRRIRGLCECCCCSESCCSPTQPVTHDECCSECYQANRNDNSFTECIKNIWETWSYFCCSNHCISHLRHPPSSLASSVFDVRCCSCWYDMEHTGSCERFLERVGKACERGCFSQGCIKPAGADDDQLCCSYFCDKTD